MRSYERLFKKDLRTWATYMNVISLCFPENERYSIYHYLKLQESY
jgi:hypothetical protein